MGNIEVSDYQIRRASRIPKKAGRPRRSVEMPFKVQRLKDEGKSDTAIMRRFHWRSPRTVSRYLKLAREIKGQLKEAERKKRERLKAAGIPPVVRSFITKGWKVMTISQKQELIQEVKQKMAQNVHGQELTMLYVVAAARALLS